MHDHSLESSSYLLLSHDHFVVKDFVHLSDSIAALGKTGAHGLYFSLGTHIQCAEDLSSYQQLPPLLPINAISKEKLSSWQFATGEGEWKTVHPFDFVLYSKEELKNACKNLPFHDLSSLEDALRKKQSLSELGLFYAQSKCVKNLLSSDILDRFEQGLKLDITSYFQIQNKSTTTDKKIVLINR